MCGKLENFLENRINGLWSSKRPSASVGRIPQHAVILIKF